jgi:hypothetical protein
MSNANSFRLVGAGTTFLSPTDFIVQVDTSAGAVTLILPKIDTILSTYATIQQFIGVRFVDISNNASVNNITIAGFETNTINGDRSIVLNTDGVGGMISLIGTSQWNFVQNSVGGNGGGNYLLQELPTPSCVNYLDRNAIGQIYEYGITEFNTDSNSFILLDNGDVVSVKEPCCILVDETIIVPAPFFASDGIDPTKRAYFLAFKKSASDSTKLEFLTYLKTTTEFEAKIIDASGGNCRLISETEPTAIFMNTNTDFSAGGNLSESQNLKLVYNSATNTLTSEVFLPFPNPISALDLFNQATGLSVTSDYWSPEKRYPLYNGQLGGTALMNGEYESVWWLINSNTEEYPVDKGIYNYVFGIDFVTGETFITDAQTGVENLTNFTPIDMSKAINDFYSHPKGVQFYLNDGQTPDNGNNNIGVTGIFSTLWTNNTKCIYLNSRCQENGLFSNTNGAYGNIGNNFDSKIKYGYYDKEYIFQLGFSVDWQSSTANNIILWRWKLDSQDLEFETLQIPLAWSDAGKSINYGSVTSANGYSLAFGYEGMVVNTNSFSPTSNGIYWDDKEVNPVQLKSNLNFLSALLNSESYNLMATNSYGGYLVMIDSYDSVKF